MYGTKQPFCADVPLSRDVNKTLKPETETRPKTFKIGLETISRFRDRDYIPAVKKLLIYSTNTKSNWLLKLCCHNQKWSRFEFSFLDWSWSGCPLDRFQNVADLFPCRWQPIHRVSWQVPQTVWDIQISPEMPYFAMVRKVEGWCGICIRDRITIKS